MDSYISQSIIGAQMSMIRFAMDMTAQSATLMLRRSAAYTAAPLNPEGFMEQMGADYHAYATALSRAGMIRSQEAMAELLRVEGEEAALDMEMRASEAKTSGNAVHEAQQAAAKHAEKAA